MRGLVRDMDILVEAPTDIQKDFLAPDFYLNCFFLCFFLLFNKRILLLSSESFFMATLYLRGKAK